jgi:hypothetical protein
VVGDTDATGRGKGTREKDANRRRFDKQKIAPGVVGKWWKVCKL